MRTSILLAAAAAVTLAFVGAGPSAEAQGGPMGGSMMYPMTQSKAAKAPGKGPAARGYLPRSAAKGPGRCGTHMYWKGGKCHDARSPGKK